MDELRSLVDELSGALNPQQRGGLGGGGGLEALKEKVIPMGSKLCSVMGALGAGGGSGILGGGRGIGGGRGQGFLGGGGRGYEGEGYGRGTGGRGGRGGGGRGGGHRGQDFGEIDA